MGVRVQYFASLKGYGRLNLEIWILDLARVAWWKGVWIVYN
jgi:hypothetical protein